MKITIKCLQSGKTCDLVRLFLTTAFEDFDANKYAMTARNTNTQIDFADPKFVIHPGFYVLILKDGTALSLQKKYIYH